MLISEKMFRELRILGESCCFEMTLIYKMLPQASDIFQKALFMPFFFFATTMTLLSHALGIYSPPHQKYKVVFFAYKTAFSRGKKKKKNQSPAFFVLSLTLTF